MKGERDCMKERERKTKRSAKEREIESIFSTSKYGHLRL